MEDLILKRLKLSEPQTAPPYAHGRHFSISAPPADKPLAWGRRHRASWVIGLACAVFMACCPILVMLVWIALEDYDASITAAITALKTDGVASFASQHIPHCSSIVVVFYAAWITFQAALYTFLPAQICKGQLTPAGNLLEYKPNGFLAWIVTLLLAVVAVAMGVVNPAVIANNWGSLVCVFNIYGAILALAFYIKAHASPSHPKDRKFSGSIFYDLFMGIELNPRLGKLWDVKLFHNGRPGIIGWTLIDLSFTALQYQRFGYITSSMIVVDILHAIYVADFFLNEAWYTRTIDICHEHFGFYLAWGSAVFLPTIYTLQTQYLARHSVQLHPAVAAGILFFGLGGYALFRTVNHQKDLVRQTQGNCMIWGREPEFIRCSYKTSDGSTHESLLLCSGGWGIVRHANYVGDLMLSYAMCAVCGLNHLLPWTYAIFMTIILVHRCCRDEAKCSKKYGKQWQIYCMKVKWRLLPGIF